MKNSNKILLLFVFLCVYFIAPRDVLAARACVCRYRDQDAYKLLIERPNDAVSSGSQNVNYVFHWPGWTGDNNPGNNDSPSTSVLGTLDHGNFDKNAYTSGDAAFTPLPSASSGGSVNPVCPGYMIVANNKVYLFDEDKGNKAKETQEKFNKDYSDCVAMGLSTEEECSSAHLNYYMECKNINDPINPGSQDESVSQTQSAANEDEDKNKEKNEQINVYREKQAASKDAASPNIKQSKQTCSDVLGDSGKEGDIAWILQKLFNYIRIFGILLVVVFSALEFTKTVVSSDYQSMKKSQSKLVMRMAAIVGLIMLPVLVNFLLGLFISGSVTDFTCGIK